MIPGNYATSGYRNPEIDKKKTFLFVNNSAKNKHFLQIFWGIAQIRRYYRFMKKAELKNHMLLSLEANSSRTG